MAQPKKTAEINGSSTPSRKKNTKERTTEIQAKGKTIMENITEELATSHDALKIQLVEKAQTPTAGRRPAVQFFFENRLRYMLPDGYTKQLIEIDKISRSWIDDCRHPPCFCDRTTDKEHDHIASFLHAFLALHNHRVDVILSKEYTLFFCDMMCMYGTAAAANEYGTLTTDKDVCNKIQEL